MEKSMHSNFLIIQPETYIGFRNIHMYLIDAMHIVEDHFLLSQALKLKFQRRKFEP